MAKKQVSKKPDKTFQLIKAIRGKKQKNNDGEPSLYKANIRARDRKVRRLTEELSLGTEKSMLPGQLIMFNYFEPKTKEDLEYYDAMPCTIFFGTIKTDNGPRVIGFNLHYYPPKIRYAVLDRIFDIFKPMYLESWDKPLDSEIPDFNYKMIMRQLQASKLDFGIREYIPKLMAKITPIPPNMWQKAVFSEGHFKKRTREAILKYWSNWKEKMVK